MPLVHRSLRYATLLTLTVAACGAETVPSPGYQPAAGGYAPTPTRPADTDRLIVENRYNNVTLTGVFLSLSAKSTWGSNQLDGKLLPPGEDLTLSGVPCDEYYDLRVTGLGGSEIATVSEIFFECGFDKVVTLGR